MISFNSYIDGLDLSALNEYCVNHGRLTQYAKGDLSSKQVKNLDLLGLLNVATSTTYYIIPLNKKTILQALLLRVSSWAITQIVFLARGQK